MNEAQRHLNLPGGQRLELVQGDITREQVDAIVNAANERLMHGGGLAGVIARKGGRQIQEESAEWVREHGPVGHAAPAHTSGGELPCRYVIHAVGPVWGSGGEEGKLAAAVEGCLRVADELGSESLALPAISTGIFGYPKEKAARVILEGIEGYFHEHIDSGVKTVRLVLFDEATRAAFEDAWEVRWPG